MTGGVLAPHDGPARVLDNIGVAAGRTRCKICFRVLETLDRDIQITRSFLAPKFTREVFPFLHVHVLGCEAVYANGVVKV